MRQVACPSYECKKPNYFDSVYEQGEVPGIWQSNGPGTDLSDPADREWSHRGFVYVYNCIGNTLGSSLGQVTVCP
jgi:hypothetical protein